MVAVYFITSSAVQTAEGLITKTSSHSVKETMDRFEKIHHGQGLQRGCPCQPYCCGNKIRYNTAADRTSYLRVTFGYIDPAWPAKRHGIADQDKAFIKMTCALDTFSDAAIK